MAAEILLPTGFFVFFFGVASVATAILASTGLLPSFVSQGLAFVSISIVCVALLRRPLLGKFHVRTSTRPVDSLVGETAKALESIAPQAIGRVELRGSFWSALNTGAAPIPAGHRCRVEGIEGLTLHVGIR